VILSHGYFARRQTVRWHSTFLARSSVKDPHWVQAHMNDRGIVCGIRSDGEVVVAWDGAPKSEVISPGCLMKDK
jgi:hypothetical protein